MKDIKLAETCEHCGENLTLMESVSAVDGALWLVKRCLKCGCRPVEEVVRVHISTDKSMMEWLEWKCEIVEWGKIFCPMVGEEVMTYYPKGRPAYDTVTAPFVDSDGDVCYYKFDQDEGCWEESIIVFCTKEEWDSVEKAGFC